MCFSNVFSTYCVFYYHLYIDNPIAVLALTIFIRLINLVVTCMFTYLNVYRWIRLVAIRQNSCMVKFNRLTISEKRYIINIIPIIAYTLFRAVWYFTTTAANSKIFWQSQTEGTITADVCVSYLSMAWISSKL